MSGKFLTTLLKAANRYRITVLLAGFILVSLPAIGCNSGPKLIPATGKVTYKGKPLPKATVVFVSDGDARPAFTTTNEEGQFAISTDGRPGAQAGSYKVAITAIRQLRPVAPEQAAAMTNEQIAANHENLIPVKYNNAISSGLSAIVSEDPAANSYTFNLQ